MLFGHYFRLFLVYLAVLVGRYFAEPPSVGRSIKCIKEENNRTEELNSDDACTVYQTSQSAFVPVIADVNHSKSATEKTFFTNGNTLPVEYEKSFGVDVASHAVSISQNEGESSSFNSHSSGMTHSISANQNNKPYTFGPNNSSHSVNTNLLNQDQFKGHLTGSSPLTSIHADGPQHGGKAEALLTSLTQVNEKTTIRRYNKQGIESSRDVPSYELKPNINLKSLLQFPTQREQAPFIQQPWKLYTLIAKDQALKDQSVSSRHNPGGQISTKMNNVLRDHQIKYMPAFFIKVRSNTLPRGDRSYESSKSSSYRRGASGPIQIKDKPWTTQHNPFSTYLATWNSTTNKRVKSSQNKPSVDTKGKTIYTSSAFQPSLNFLNKSNTDPDKAKLFGSHPGSPSLSSYLEQQNLRKLDTQQNIPTPQRAVQWISIKPRPSSSQAWEDVQSGVQSLSRQQEFSIASQSASRNYSTHRSQNQVDYSNSNNAHAIWDFKPLPLNTLPAGIQNSHGEAGSTHSHLTSEAPLLQGAPSITSQGALTADRYLDQTSTFENHKKSEESQEWQPSREPPSVNSAIWPATVSLVEDISVKQIHDYHSHLQNNLGVPEYPSVSNSEDHGQSNIILSSQTSYDLPVLEYGKTNLEIEFGGLQPGQGKSETSNGRMVNEFLSPEMTKISSTSNPVVSIDEYDSSIINNYLAIESGMISKTIANNPEKPHRQDLSDASDVTGDASNKHVFNEYTSLPNRDADQTLDHSLNSSHSQFVQNNEISESNFISSGEAAHISKPTQTSLSSSHTSGNLLPIDGFLSGSDIYSDGESSTHNLTVSHSFRPQKGIGNQESISSSEFELGSLESNISQNGTGHFQTAAIPSHPEQLQLKPLESRDQINSTKRIQMQNNQLADTIQQYGSRADTMQSSRPTSSVVVGKHIKVYSPDDMLKSGSEQGQTTTYRSPIFRLSKLKTNISDNETMDFSMDNTTYQNNLRLNESTKMHSPEVEADLSSKNVTQNFSGTKISIKSKPNAHEGSENGLDQTNFIAIQSSDVVGSATFTVHSGWSTQQNDLGVWKKLSNSTQMQTASDLGSPAAGEDLVQPTK